MAFPVLPVPTPGSQTFNVDAQLFATGLASFAQEANDLGSVIDLSLKSTSTTSLTIGTGSKTLTVQTGLGYVIGHPARIASVASPSNFMDGIVTAYDTITGSMTVNVLSVGGSGTIASWNTMVLPGGGNFASLSNNKFTGRQVFADEVTIASAATLNFTTGNSNQFVVTGSVTITSVTMDQGAVVKAVFTGGAILTNSANLQIQGGANYTPALGDVLTFTSNGTVVRVEISTKSAQPIFIKTASNDGSFSDNAGNPVSSDWVKGLAKFTKEYVSSQQVITSGGALTLAHSLGIEPKLIQLYLVPQTSVDGYTSGREIPIPNNIIVNGVVSRGAAVQSDATNINIRFGSDANAFILLNFTTSAVTAITNTNYKLVAKAWA